MLLVDHQIRDLCKTEEGVTPMITPFSESTSGNGVISYGLDHAGYCLRLGKIIYAFKNTFGTYVDPKMFRDQDYHKRVFDTREFEYGDRIIIPANGYILGHSLEYLYIPPTIKGRCVGKSTLARCGIVINTTPLEPEWQGHLTIEIANNNPCPAVVYCGEGICQLEFERLDGRPAVTYADKGGQYQCQTGVTPARVK